MTTPTKPASFHPELAPDGVEVLFYSLWRERPLLRPCARLAVLHTNAARGEGSVESASNWSERNTWGDGKSYTIPHYQVDRDGRSRKILPTNRRGIANSTGSSVEAENTISPAGYKDASWFSIAIETADTGTDDDPAISAYTPEQIEAIAEILAYESLVPGSEIVLDLPADWFREGTCSHTSPFPYPCLTTVRGKTCPGAKKKAQLPEILARARAIRAAWTAAPAPAPEPTPTPTPAPAPTPTPTEEYDIMSPDGMIYAAKAPSGGWFVGDGKRRIHTGGHRAKLRLAAGLIVAASATRATTWGAIPISTEWFLNTYLGAWDGTTSEA